MAKIEFGRRGEEERAPMEEHTGEKRNAKKNARDSKARRESETAPAGTGKTRDRREAR